MADRAVLLVDTNVIIEAVRTGCWRALTGRFAVEAVRACRDEALAGDPESAGYVQVSADDLARITQVHDVSPTERAALSLAYPDADGLDDGERDLFAHALHRDDDLWILSSPDRAAIRAGLTLGWREQLMSLGDLVTRIGVHPKPPLRTHFEEPWLSDRRRDFLLRL